MKPIQVLKNALQRLRSGETNVESENLDIKGEWYSNTKKENWKFEFAKDVCAMANALDSGKGYLIFGLLNRKPYLKNIEIIEDEAVLQEIIKSNITPIPKIKLKKVIIEDCSIYVLSINGSIRDMPFFALRPNKDQFIYIRRGSSTGLCTKEELERIIKAKLNSEINIQVESLAIKSIKDIQYKISQLNIDHMEGLLSEMDQYSTGYSHKVSGEVLSVLYDVESRLRGKKRENLTIQISEIARRALPIYNLVSESKTEITAEQIVLLKQGLWLAREIGYRATRRQQLKKVLGAGTDILHDILRFSHLNGLTELEEESVGVFDELKKYAAKSGFNDAVRWLKFNRQDALALDGEDLPDFPSDLVDLFS